MACPPGGFPADHLSSRFTGTCWEPLAMGRALAVASQWQSVPRSRWRRLPRARALVGFQRLLPDYAEYREALRIMRAVDGFNSWLLHAPGRAHTRRRASSAGPALRIASQLSSICPSPTATPGAPARALAPAA